MNNKKRIIHVWSNGIYIGNIMYKREIPLFSEEEFEDMILEYFPQLINKHWNIVI